MNDVTLLVLLGNRDNFTRFSPLVKDYVLSKDCFEIYKVVDMYYRSYPSTTEINWDEFSTFFFLVKKPRPEKIDVLRSIIGACKTKQAEIAGKAVADLPEFYKQVLKHYIKLDYVSQIADKSIALATSLVSEKDEGIEDIDHLITQCKKELEVADDESKLFVKGSLEDMAVKLTTEGFEWPLEELNESLGPARGGDFILFAARVNAGKSTFGADTVRYWLPQLKAEQGPIIWVNNEEVGEKVYYRIKQSYFGVTTEDLIKNAKTYDAEFELKCGSKLLLVTDDAGFTHTRKLDQLFKKYKPSVIVFDQLDKVDIRGDFAREDIKLGALYKWARFKAKEYNAVVLALSQVNSSGEGQQWLQQNQLRGSATDKPGELDAIIMAGMSNDDTKKYSRFIHIAKNKLIGGPRSREEFRHGHYEVTLKPEIARYVGRKR